MNAFAGFNLLIGTTSLLFALLIIRFGNVRNILHITLLLLNIALVIWGYGCMMSALSDNPASAMFWWKIAHAGGLYTVVFFLHHVLALTENKGRRVLIFGYIMATAFQVCAAADLLQIKMTYVFDSYFYITPVGMAYPIFTFLWCAIGFYASFILFDAFRKSHGEKKVQFKVLLMALVICFLAGVSHFLTVYHTNIYPFGALLVPALPIVATYGILRHRLLDIEVIVRKTLVFAGLLASVFAALILPTLLIQEYIFRGAGFGGKMLGLAVSGVIIIASFRRIEDFLINITDRFLFQKRYDYKELLKTFTSEVLTVLDLNKLVKLTVDKLSDIIRLQSCGILLLNDEKNEYHLAASRGIKEKNVVLNVNNTLTSFLTRTKMCLSIKAHGKEYQLPEKIVLDMNRLKLELAIPLMTSQDEMIGILTLGAKKSDEEYTQDDMDILLPLAGTLAIAISNAEMFVELGKTQAEAAQREKMAVIGTLSAGINHEICNPLGIARGQCEAFLLNIKDGLYKNRTHQELVEKARKIMEKVIHETDRATTITKRLSTFAKPSKGDISNDISVKYEIDEVLALVGYEMKLDHIDVMNKIDENLPFISGDKKQLQEVFFNLIRNAAQAMNEKGRITVTAREDSGKVIMCIEDTGHGIPKDKLAQIFNPFYTTKEPGEGTGLGLFIVRQVVERNRGRISVKSKVGEGTTFVLEFPAVAKVKV